jgi:hypothetical protein
MERRVRLTSRDRQAVEDDTPYPGNVNQPERKFKRMDQYDTFVQRVNHELPDMRHDWKNDERDEIGFGIPEPYGTQPTVASVRVAASKAVRIAVLLLGEKVGDEVIEAQARELLAMGDEAMDATLARFAETQKLYEAAEKDDEELAAKAIQEKKEEEAKTSSETETVTASDDSDDDDDEESKEASEKLVVESGGTKPTADVPQPTVGDEDKNASTDDKFEAAVAERLEAMRTVESAEEFEARVNAEVAKRLEADSKKAEDDEDDDDDDDGKEAASEEGKPAEASDESEEGKPAEAAAEEGKPAEAATEEAAEEGKPAEAAAEEAPLRLEGPNEMDIELTSSSMDDEVQTDPATQKQLAGLWEKEVPTEEAAPVQRTAKAGIKKLGGQPRVVTASAAAPGDISGIWKDAPDVSRAFE